MKKKSFRQNIRKLHGQIGFLLVGLLVVYSLSGIILTYRDTNFLKKENKVTKTLQPGLTATELGEHLRMRHFEVKNETRETINFQGGEYNKLTGTTNLTNHEIFPWIKPLIDLHKSSSKGLAHYFTTILGVLLFFMAVSSFWMFRPGSKSFRQSIYLTLGGIVVVVILLVI